MAALGALHRRLADTRLGCDLGLRPISLEAVALEPAAELCKDGGIGDQFIKMHQF